MVKATTVVPAVVPAVVRDAEIGTLINQAGQAAASMLAKCKEAAAAAALQLNPATPIQQRISDVVALYAADFTAAGHNVKSLFVDALTLHAAASAPVVVSVIGKDGKRVDEATTAAAAVDLSKHSMRDAAKQVREQNNMGRKSGGGAKPKAAAAPAVASITAADIDAFSAWLENLEPYFTDAVYHQKIVARLIDAGYVVSKATKGRVVKGAASA